MKMNKWCVAVLAGALLAGCGGTGFEGKYEVSAGSDMLGDMSAAMGAAMGKNTIEIGSDYIESNGQRQHLDKLFVRETNGKRFLVAAAEGKEDAMEIVDDNTLQKGNGIMKIVFHRVK